MPDPRTPELFARPLFVLELANNHMGDAAHGVRIIEQLAAAVAPFRDRFGFAVKFQYRDLDTFLHPEDRERLELKYVRRFTETRLQPEELLHLRETVSRHDFFSVCTPFDEASVELAIEHGHHALKIASCSLADWPLIERVAAAGRPLIASTAGANTGQLDAAVALLTANGQDLTLMHCVALYPTPEHDLDLDRIDVLSERYPGLRIGFSTHEHPDSLLPVQLAVAKGAVVFEKHVGVPTTADPLNAYSATPGQVRAWVEAADRATRLQGGNESRPAARTAEQASLAALERGVLAARPLRRGETIGAGDCRLAFPPRAGQLRASALVPGVRLSVLRDRAEGERLGEDDVRIAAGVGQLEQILERVATVLRAGRLSLPRDAVLELSHHHGLEAFHRWGATVVSVVDRSYCKKLLILLPGQAHPEHRHGHKEETFVVLHGDVELVLDGERRACSAGDVVTVTPGQMHGFSSRNGAVLDEVGTRERAGDSSYADTSIPAVELRKTVVPQDLAARLRGGRP